MKPFIWLYCLSLKLCLNTLNIFLASSLYDWLGRFTPSRMCWERMRGFIFLRGRIATQLIISTTTGIETAAKAKKSTLLHRDAKEDYNSGLSHAQLSV